MPYQGRSGKLGGPVVGDFTLLKPLATIEGTILLGPLYGLANNAKYEVACRLKLSVIVGSAEPSPSSDRTIVELQSNTIILALTDYVERSAEEAFEGPRVVSPASNATAGLLQSTSISWSSCSSSQMSTVNSAVSKAKSILTSVVNYFSGSCDRNYVDIFGSHSGSSRWATAQGTYKNEQTRLNSAFGINCNPGSCGGSSTYAYTYPWDTSSHTIYLCNKFWAAPTADGMMDTQWGTLMHELSHFNDVHTTTGTQDYTYGLASCRALAISNPNNAVNNADNYEYFGENLSISPC